MNNNICIGILGGGQLARMSAYQAYKLGFNIAIYEKSLNSPAGLLTKMDFAGDINDYQQLDKFAEVSNYITLENEFIDHKHLSHLEEIGKKVIPSSSVIEKIQDKLIQKNTLSEYGIPVAKYISINDSITYEDVKLLFGEKFLLKSRTMGYDGYGNYLVKSKEDFLKGLETIGKRGQLMAEEFINFSKELAIMVVRTEKEFKFYPVVETIQENHICDMVIAPAQINESLSSRVIEIAEQCLSALDGYGLYGIELFLDVNDNVLVNEIAPRPHNSGHYTIEGTVTSQFENHIRSILNLPLGSTELVKKYSVMVNLLGKDNSLGLMNNYAIGLQNENMHLHIYGKSESRKGRKMGHITLVGDNLEELVNNCKEFQRKILI